MTGGSVFGLLIYRQIKKPCQFGSLVYARALAKMLLEIRKPKLF